MSFPADIARMLIFRYLGRAGANYGATCRRYYEWWLEYVSGEHARAALLYYAKHGMTDAAARILLRCKGANLWCVEDAAARDGNPAMIKLLVHHGCSFDTPWFWDILVNNSNYKALEIIWNRRRISYQSLLLWSIHPRVSPKMLSFILRQMGAKPRRYLYRDTCVEVQRQDTHGGLMRTDLASNICLTCHGAYCYTFDPKHQCHLAVGNVAYHIDFTIMRAIQMKNVIALKKLLCHVVLRTLSLTAYCSHAWKKDSHECEEVIRIFLMHARKLEDAARN